MRKRKTRPLLKAATEPSLYEPRNKRAPQPYRNSPLVYLQNGPKKDRYRKNAPTPKRIFALKQ